MPAKKRSAKKKIGAALKRRRQDDPNNLDMEDLDSADFEQDMEPVGYSMPEGDDKSIHFNTTRRDADEDPDEVNPLEPYAMEGKGIDAGIGDHDKEEEELALDAQRRINRDFEDDDFLIDDMKVPSSGKAPKKSSSARDLDALSQFLANAEETFGAEKVATDYSTLSEDAKRALLDREAPELRAMLGDFREKLASVRDVLAPVLQKVKDGEIETNKGVGFLEMKLHLFLTYLMHLSFYLLLKAEGKPVKGNPVVAKLVELRSYMDKLKPVEKKLQHQISRLLSRAAVRATGGEIAETDRANIDALGEGDEMGETYVAPKHGTARLGKEEKKLREERLLAMAGKAKDAAEEDMMGRSTTTRNKDKLLRKAKENFSIPEDDVDDDEGRVEGLDAIDATIGTTSLMARVAQRRNEKLERAKRQLEEEAEEAEEMLGDDEEGEEDEEDEEVEEEEDAAEARKFMSEEIDRMGRDKKKKKREMNAQRQFGGKSVENLGQRAGEVKDGHRMISKEITKNRGLVPERKKKFKNPRVRSKWRADKLLNKVKNQVKPVVKPLHKYRGEKAKIRTDVIRSIPMS